MQGGILCIFIIYKIEHCVILSPDHSSEASAQELGQCCGGWRSNARSITLYYNYNCHCHCHRCQLFSPACLMTLHTWLEPRGDTPDLPPPLVFCHASLTPPCLLHASAGCKTLAACHDCHETNIFQAQIISNELIY